MRLWVAQGGWQPRTGSPGLEHSCLPLACCRHRDATELLCSITEAAFPRPCFWREGVPKGVQFSDKWIKITQKRTCILLGLQTQVKARVLQCSLFLQRARAVAAGPHLSCVPPCSSWQLPARISFRAGAGPREPECLLGLCSHSPDRTALSSRLGQKGYFPMAPFLCVCVFPGTPHARQWCHSSCS